MTEQITILNEDDTWTIIAAMTPSDGTPPPSGQEPGLQLIDEEEEE
jgi:hypothetical protein